MRRKIAAGNWKMNGTRAALQELQTLRQMLPPSPPEVVICPPFPLLTAAVDTAAPVAVGAQNCHAQPAGAFTGDVSAEMISDAGATYVILGHSERRTACHETDAEVRDKTTAAHAAGLTAIICIGETLAEREANTTLAVLAAQLAGSVPDSLSDTNTVIAYEPIWAIGTGKIPSLAQIIEVHDALRKNLTARFGAKTADAIPLLYGGSVKPDNAAMIFEADNVDGALVGGASLKAADFAPIITALATS